MTSNYGNLLWLQRSPPLFQTMPMLMLLCDSILHFAHNAMWLEGLAAQESRRLIHYRSVRRNILMINNI